MSDNKKTVEGQPTRPFTELDSFWLETGRAAVKETCNRQEDAAKQIISITSALQAIYFAALSFSDLKNALMSQDIDWRLQIVVVALFISPIILWFCSLCCALRVVVPETGDVDLESPGQVGELYKKSVNYKSIYLRRAHKALVWGFVSVVVNIVIYIALYRLLLSLSF